MRLLSERDAFELRAIVDAVPDGVSGRIGPEQLASKAGVPVERVDYLLRQHPRYFVNVGARNAYSLSRLAAHRGSRAKIAAEIEASIRESAQSLRLRAVLPLASLAAAAGVAIAFLFGRQQWIAALVVALLPSLAPVCIGMGRVTRRRHPG